MAVKIFKKMQYFISFYVCPRSKYERNFTIHGQMRLFHIRLMYSLAALYQPAVTNLNISNILCLLYYIILCYIILYYIILYYIILYYIILYYISFYH